MNLWPEHFSTQKFTDFVGCMITGVCVRIPNFTINTFIYDSNTLLTSVKEATINKVAIYLHEQTEFTLECFLYISSVIFCNCTSI